MLGVLCICLISPALSISWKFDFSSYPLNGISHLGLITATSATRKVFLLAGSHIKHSPLSMLLMNGGLDSEVLIDEAKFFSHNVTLFRESIHSQYITEAHGVVFLKYCSIPDPSNKAELDPKDFGNPCLFFGDGVNWTLIDFQKTDYYGSLIFRASGSHAFQYLEEDGFIEHHFTVSAADVTGGKAPLLRVAGGLGVTNRVIVHGLKMPKPTNRLGLSLMMLTNTSIDDHEMFVQEDTMNLLDEVENGNLRSTTLYLGRLHPPSTKPVSLPAAYLFWRSVCYMGAAFEKMEPRTVKSMQSHTERIKPDKIHFSVPTAVFNERFNPNPVVNKTTVAIRQQLLLFGTPEDDFYVGRRHVEWYFILSIGDPLFSGISTGYFYLLLPLLLTVLAALTVSSTLYFLKSCFSIPVTSTDEVTPLLIEEVTESDQGPSSSSASLGFEFSRCQQPWIHPASNMESKSYGAI